MKLLSADKVLALWDIKLDGLSQAGGAPWPLVKEAMLQFRADLDKLENHASTNTAAYNPSQTDWIPEGCDPRPAPPQEQPPSKAKLPHMAEWVIVPEATCKVYNELRRLPEQNGFVRSLASHMQTKGYLTPKQAKAIYSKLKTNGAHPDVLDLVDTMSKNKYPTDQPLGAKVRDMEFKGKIKKLTVKVEDIETGEIVKSFDCGKDERRASRLEDSLIDRTNLDKYHVYQSVVI